MTTTSASWRKRLAGWVQALLAYQPGTIGHTLYAYKYTYDLGDEALMQSARCLPQRLPALLETRLPAALTLETVTPIAQAVGCDAVGLLALLMVATTAGAPPVQRLPTPPVPCVICQGQLAAGEGVYREVYRIGTREEAKQRAHEVCLHQAQIQARQRGVPLAAFLNDQFE
jgi:hypothetical protein